MSSQDSKLNGREKFDLAVESGLQIIPYVGGALSTAYFGTKNEKRLKRIESFYKEFGERIEELEIKIPQIPEYKKEEIVEIIERLNEKIERESKDRKREYYKKYLANTLLNAERIDNDESVLFLDILEKITYLEIDMLNIVRSHSKARVGDIKATNIDKYAIVGAVGRLKSYGFLITETGNVTIGGGVDNSLNEIISMSSYGEKFIRYCLL